MVRCARNSVTARLTGRGNGGPAEVRCDPTSRPRDNATCGKSFRTRNGPPYLIRSGAGRPVTFRAPGFVRTQNLTLGSSLAARLDSQEKHETGRSKPGDDRDGKLSPDRALSSVELTARLKRPCEARGGPAGVGGNPGKVRTFRRQHRLDTNQLILIAPVGKHPSFQRPTCLKNML